MKVQPMLQVDDVEASSRWYQSVVGLVSGHGGAEYEMLFAGTPFATPLLLQLHRWDAREHGFLGDPSQPRGNGTSLWFEVDDRAALDALWERAQAQGAEVIEAPHWSPLAHHHELALRDPDGYVVVAATPFEPGQPG
ncbi:MAG: VOC family protein [Myxococcota bacterium]